MSPGERLRSLYCTFSQRWCTKGSCNSSWKLFSNSFHLKHAITEQQYLLLLWVLWDSEETHASSTVPPSGLQSETHNHLSTQSYTCGAWASLNWTDFLWCEPLTLLCSEKIKQMWMECKGWLYMKGELQRRMLCRRPAAIFSSSEGRLQQASKRWAV